MHTPFARKLLTSIILLLLAALPAAAANKVWLTTADGNFGTTGNWSGGTPTTGDNVFFPPGTPAVNAGLDQHTVALGTVYFQAGYKSNVGSASGYLRIKCTGLIYAGTGTAYIDLGAENITANVANAGTGTSSTGAAGLYLLGSNLATLAVAGGNVALAGQIGETSTVATVRSSGSSTVLTLGSGVTLTAASVSSGTLNVNCAATTLNVSGGKLYTGGSGAFTTVNVSGGNCYPASSGLVTNLNLTGGITDATTIGLPRTISNLLLDAGASFAWDPAVLTISAWTAPSFPLKYSASAN